MEVFQFICCSIFMILGLLVMLGAAIGNWRFSSALPRMHSVAMGDSVGKLCLVIGLLLCNWDALAKMKLLFILVFFWMSGPVCSHLLCKYQVEEEQRIKEGK